MANLIIYYSRKGENYWNGSIRDISKGNTERVAEFIQAAVGGKLFEIRTVREYDKDYYVCIEEAKQELRDKSDAVVVLPGGIGTMEEFFETIVQKQLGLYDKPIILFNQDGYYDHLEAWLNHCHAEQFFRYEGDERLWQCINSVDALRQLLKDMA